MSELKPCPFCGGPVKLEKTVGEYNQRHGSREWWGVVCRNMLNLGGTCAIQQIPSASKEAAIERWNFRAQPEANADAKDALKIAVEALQKVSTWSFGWDGDCGVRNVADDALAAINAARQAKESGNG